MATEDGAGRDEMGGRNAGFSSGTEAFSIHRSLSAQNILPSEVVNSPHHSGVQSPVTLFQRYTRRGSTEVDKEQRL